MVTFDTTNKKMHHHNFPHLSSKLYEIDSYYCTQKNSFLGEIDNNSIPEKVKFIEEFQ